MVLQLEIALLLLNNIGGCCNIAAAVTGFAFVDVDVVVIGPAGNNAFVA